MNEAAQSSLVVVIGDVHGRFHRVREWIATLESVRGRNATLVLAVGDIEAFRTADDHRRKAAKRNMPAEFADYATGRCSLDRPLYFIGGNNEDFEALHPHPEGAELARNLHYLGRVGQRSLAGLDVGYLSGIYAPRYVDKPLLPPTTAEACKQAGYFRLNELESLEGMRDIDVMLTHEWPRGIASRAGANARGIFRDLAAYRTPWIGNGITRNVVSDIRPSWLFCGHSHVAFATAITHEDGSLTRVACLDQASRSDGAVFWTEWESGRAVRAGWGVSGETCWDERSVWDERCTPACGQAERSAAPRRERTTDTHARIAVKIPPHSPDESGVHKASRRGAQQAAEEEEEQEPEAAVGGVKR